MRRPNGKKDEFITDIVYCRPDLQLDTDIDRLCGLEVRVPGYRSRMYCDSSEVRTEFIYVM
jgi:hypothetical protein